jgi:hypothetical protein
MSVEMQADGARLTLFFDPETAWTGKAPLVEVRLTPTTGGEFMPWLLMPKLPLHLQYARASIAHKRSDAATALQALRQVGKTRRGLGNDFLRIIAMQYEALVAEGERYPIKALAAAMSADKSTASRWVKEARRRGLLPPKEA